MINAPPAVARLLPFAAALLAAAFGSAPARAQEAPSREMFEAVRTADMTLATIGFRLGTANAPLCDRLEPGLGLQLHTLDQFSDTEREAARAHFRFASPVAIEGVIADGPAARAGLRPDDSLVRIGPVDLAALPGAAGSTDRLVAAHAAIAALPPAAPLVVQYLRDGVAGSVTVTPLPACYSRFELLIDRSYKASGYGSFVQIGARYLEEYSETQVAGLVAHEFAHNILHHRDRLIDRGVSWGVFSGIGGSVKYFRQTELQADLLSVYLLANAGYPPDATVAFLRSFGPSKAGSPLRSRSHPHWRDRVRTMEAEIARVQVDPRRPLIPALIAERSQPLSGDWQSLIVRK